MNKNPLSLRDIERLDRLEWIVALRWIAVISIFSIIFSARQFFHLYFNTARIYPVIFLIIAYNFIFLLYTRNIKSTRGPALELPYISHNLAFTQGIVDISFLTIILHYSGGLENPFIFFYVFHIIIASLLLNKKAAFIQALFSCMLITSLSIIEYYSILPHHSIAGFLKTPLYNNNIFVIAVNVVFWFTMIISVLIATSINEKIAKKEDELKDARLRLEKANASLQEQDRLKSEYTMMVSHDLKSPLSSIKSLIDVVIGGHTGELNKKTIGVLNRISKRIDGMMKFINDLLNLSRIKSEKVLKNEKLQIVDTLNSAIDEIMADTLVKGIKIEKRFGKDIPLIKGNRRELKEIFLNILTNAVRYNRKNGYISIDVKKADKYIHIEITDSGIGMHKEDIPRIFDEFYRTDNAKKHTPEGSGLGLSLVKYAVERHGGKITVESSPGKGSKFTITIPFFLFS